MHLNQSETPTGKQYFRIEHDGLQESRYANSIGDSKMFLTVDVD